MNDGTGIGAAGIIHFFAMPWCLSGGGVKIDRAFVKDIDRSAENQALVGALVSVAHRFGMTATAKGVETQAEAACLRTLGADGLQGFLFGRPGPLPE